MMLYPVVAESRHFISLGTYRGSVTDTVFGYSANTHTFIGSGTFSNIWAPHETRLILLTGSRIVASSAIDTLNSGTMLVQAQVSHSLANSVINGTRMDTHATNSTLKQTTLEINGDEYLYNTVLSPNEMFVPDQFGVQVTVEPRR
jgi:hypothetical protein